MELPRAVELYRTTCLADGEPSACARLGYLHERGLGVAPRKDYAVALYRFACLEGDRIGCLRFGLAVEAGLHVKSDPVLAAKLLDKACSQHLPAACVEARRIRDDQRAKSGRRGKE
jgi:TPR repeat protein